VPRAALTVVVTFAIALAAVAGAAPLLELPGRIRFEPPLGLVPERVDAPLLYRAKRGALTVTVEAVDAARAQPAPPPPDGGARRTLMLAPDRVVDIVASGPEAAATVEAIAASMHLADGPERTARAVGVAPAAPPTTRAWPFAALAAAALVAGGLAAIAVKRKSTPR